MRVSGGSFLLSALFICWYSVSAALGDSSSPTLSVFSVNNITRAFYSTWNGTSWSNAPSTPNVGGEPYWIVLKNSPTRNETALGILDFQLDVNILFYDGSAWSTPTEVTNNAGTNNYRPFYLAYEQSSGDLLLSYWNNNVNKIGYRTYNGSTLSSENLLTLPSTSDVEFLTLYPKLGSDEITLVALNANSQLYAAVWNGDTWGSVTTLETNTGTNTNECYSATYETASGDGLVVYAQNGQVQPRYRTWNGSNWSAESSSPSVGGVPKWLRLTADPDKASNQILLGTLDANKDINVNVWNGSSWGTDVEVENNTGHSDRRQFDIAYENGGGMALIVYRQANLSSLRYRTWNGTSWSSEIIGTSLGGPALSIVSLTIGSVPGEIFILCSDSSLFFNLVHWDGSAMSSLVFFQATIGGTLTTEQFMVSIPAEATKKKIIYWREIPNKAL